MRRALASSSLAALVVLSAAADSVKGTLVAKAKSGDQRVTITHGYLVQGPDMLNPGSSVRWLVFASSDLSERIKKCSVLECVDPAPDSGFLVVLGSAPFLMYRHTLKKESIQYSGPVNAAALKKSADTPTRLAGTLRFDNSGANVDVEFDLTLFKTFKK